jgi:hypothetical protein
MPALYEALELCRKKFLKLMAPNSRLALRPFGVGMHKKSILDGQEYSVVLGYIQMHTDSRGVGIAVEVLEI